MKTTFQNLLAAVVLLLMLCEPAIAQTPNPWQPTYGPWGGKVTSMDTFDNYLWANTRDGGVYRSANNGTTWEVHNEGINWTPMDATVSLHSANGYLFLATTAQGILRLDDANGTWTTVLGGHFHNVCHQGTALFAAKYEPPYIFKSTDNGTTWAPSSSGITLTPYGYYGLGATNDYLLVTYYNSSLGLVQVYRSVDGGATWTLGANPDLPSAYDFNRMRVIGDKIFLFFQTTYQTPLPTYTTDGGLSWQTVANTTYNLMRFDDILYLNGRYVGMNPYFLLDFSLVGSTAATRPAPSEKYGRINEGFFLNDNKLFIYGDRLIKGDTNLTNFVFTDSLMRAFPVGAIAGNGSRIIVQPATNAIAGTSDHGNTWSVDSVYATFSTSTFKGNQWLIGGQNTGVFKSIDGGFTFKSINTGFPFVPLVPQVNVLHTTGDNKVLAGNGNKIYELEAGDTSWNLKYTFVLAGASTQPNITCLASTPSYLFAGTQGPGGTGEMYRSADGGATWTVISIDSTFNYANATAVFDGKLFTANSSYGLYKSTDWGDTWSKADSGIVSDYLNNVWLNSLGVFGTKLYGILEFDHDLYELNAGSNTWANLTPLPTDPKAISVWGSADTVLYVGTQNNGVWKRNFSPTSIGWQPAFHVLDARLYPNPGKNPQLSISSPTALPAVVEIFEAGTGRIIASQTITSAKTQLNIAGAAGTYIIHITSKDGAMARLKWVKLP